jgi:hypothetical protein
VVVVSPYLLYANDYFLGQLSVWGYPKIVIQSYRVSFVAGSSPQRPRFIPSSGYVGFVVEKSGTGTGFSLSPFFPLSISSHHCSRFTHVSSGRQAMGLLAAKFHRDIVSLHCNNNNNSGLSVYGLLAKFSIFICPIFWWDPLVNTRLAFVIYLPSTSWQYKKQC